MVKLLTDAPIAVKIKRLMDEQGWKAKPLARAANLNEYVVHNILRGQSKKPSYDKMVAIAGVLGVSVAYLLSDDEEICVQPNFISPGSIFNGFLYADCMDKTLTAYRQRMGEPNLKNHSVRKRLEDVSRMLYVHAQKKELSEPDEVFADILIEKEILASGGSFETAEDAQTEERAA